MAVVNKHREEEEKWIQKCLTLLRFGKHNSQFFHKQENPGPGGRQPREMNRGSQCSPACSHRDRHKSSDRKLGRRRQCTALNWEGQAAAATKGSSPLALLQRTGSPCPGEGETGEQSQSQPEMACSVLRPTLSTFYKPMKTWELQSSEFHQESPECFKM